MVLYLLCTEFATLRTTRGVTVTSLRRTSDHTHFCCSQHSVVQLVSILQNHMHDGQHLGRSSQGLSLIASGSIKRSELVTNAILTLVTTPIVPGGLVVSGISKSALCKLGSNFSPSASYLDTPLDLSAYNPNHIDVS